MNSTNSKVFLRESSAHSDDELFELTWNEILYDGGLATWIPRSSFRWLTIFVCVVGVIGNILAVYTLLRPRMRILPTYIFLTVLCISNTITLISVIIFEVDVLVEPSHINCFIVSTGKALASTTFALSTWITVCFTIDRYVMICFPFIGQNKCTRRNACYAIIICLIFSLTYLFPQLFSQKCHPMMEYPFNETLSIENYTFINKHDLIIPTYWVAGLSEMGKSSAYRLAVTLFFNCFLIRVIPFLLIFILNFRLIQTLAHTKQRNRQLNPYEQKHNDLTYMLVIVISMYLVCIMPSIPFAAFFAYDPHHYVDISFHYRIFQYLDEFAKFLLIFNSASQCFIYIFFGKRFRRELTSFLCCLCVKYFSMSIPSTHPRDEQDQLYHPNDAFDVELHGQWSIDNQRDSITAIEFSFHYAKRSSRSISILKSKSDLQSDGNFSLLKRFKTHVVQTFSRFK